MVGVRLDLQDIVPRTHSSDINKLTRQVRAVDVCPSGLDPLVVARIFPIGISIGRHLNHVLQTESPLVPDRDQLRIGIQKSVRVESFEMIVIMAGGILEQGIADWTPD